MADFNISSQDSSLTRVKACRALDSKITGRSLQLYLALRAKIPDEGTAKLHKLAKAQACKL